LCGAAGSGKSTFAAQHFTPTQIVSSDFCRTLISDSDSNFRINSGTFDLFHMIIQKRLKLGRRTCADSTALYAFARAPLLEMAKEADFHTCLIIFTVSLDLCLQRNAQRERLVPIHVIEDQCASLQYARREHIHTEAWDQIHELGTDVTGVRFVRKNRSVAMHQ
jgi:protein phosphatase